MHAPLDEVSSYHVRKIRSRRSQPYAYDALEPHIDAATMKVHHSGHHQTYTDKRAYAVVLRALFSHETAEVLSDNPQQ